MSFVLLYTNKRSDFHVI